MVEKIAVEITEKGPAAWEWGGGHRNSGFAQVVADSRGRPKKPICVRKHGHLALGEHALVPVEKGDHIIRAEWGPHNMTEVLRVEEINESEGSASVQIIARLMGGCWKPPLPPWLGTAVLAAEEKSRCYHCRGPHYILED